MASFSDRILGGDGKPHFKIVANTGAVVAENVTFEMIAPILQQGDYVGARELNLLLQKIGDDTQLNIDGGVYSTKNGNIKLYRQPNLTETESAPSSLPYGEIAIGNAGRIYTGNGSNIPVPHIKKSEFDASNESISASINQRAYIDHASPTIEHGLGDVGNYGHVKLSDAVDLTSDVDKGVAATPSAVKAAYDLAVKGSSTQSLEPIGFKRFETGLTMQWGTYQAPQYLNAHTEQARIVRFTITYPKPMTRAFAPSVMLYLNPTSYPISLTLLDAGLTEMLGYVFTPLNPSVDVNHSIYLTWSIMGISQKEVFE